MIPGMVDKSDSKCAYLICVELKVQAGTHQDVTQNYLFCQTHPKLSGDPVRAVQQDAHLPLSQLSLLAQHHFLSVKLIPIVINAITALFLGTHLLVICLNIGIIVFTFLSNQRIPQMCQNKSIFKKECLEDGITTFTFTFSRRFYPKRLTMYTHFTFKLMAHCTSGAIRGSGPHLLTGLRLFQA